MPLYEVTAPDGKKYQVNAPEGATQEDAIEYVATQVIPQQPAPQEATAGVGEALIGGAKRIGSDIITGVTAPFVGGEEAAQKGIARQEQITERPGASLEEVQKKYKEEGAWPAIKEAISQIPSAITEQAPFLATMWAGGKAGAALPGTPQTKVVTGFIGAALAPFLAQSGSNIQRQVEEQVAKGEDPNVSMSKAYGGATAQAALDVFSLQFGLGRLLGIKPAQFGTQQAEKLAKEKLTLMLAKGTGKTALAEIPTEMTQQLIERAQAGLDLTSPEAVQEYLSAGYTAGLISPIGGPVRAMERSDARNYLAVKEEQAKQAMQQSLDAEIARINEAKFTEEEKQRKIAEAEAKARAQRNAVLANIYTNPGKTVQEIINEATGVARPAETKKSLEERQKALETQLDEKARTYKKALNSPSGVFAKDPFTQQEYELTTGEWLGLTSPDLVSEIESTTPVEERGERLATDPVTETTFIDMGIGRTAKLHTALKGLDPLKIEDNRVIRNTLNNYLKTREAEDPRAVAVQDYLNTIPTTEELEYEPAIRDRLRSDLQVSGQPVPISPAEAFAGYDGTGIDRVPDNIREFARGEESFTDTIENDLKALREEIAKPYKGETLNSRIKKLGGILTKDFRDLAGDKSTAALNLTPGLASNKGRELGELINDGLLDDFLPFHLQSAPGSDTREAAQYLIGQLVSNTRTIPYAEQRARDELQLQHDQLSEALYLQEKEPQNQRAAEFGLTPQEEDANAILRQESAAIKEEGGISPTEEVPGETIAEARAKPKETIGQFLDRATPEELKAFSRQQLAKDMSDQGRQRRQEAIQALQTERETLVEAFKDTRDPAQRKAIRERGTAIDGELKALGYKPQFAEAPTTQTIETYNRNPVSQTEKSLINEAKEFFKNKLRSEINTTGKNEYWNQGEFIFTGFQNGNKNNAYLNWNFAFDNKLKNSNSNIRSTELQRAAYALARQELGDFEIQLDPVWGAPDVQPTQLAEATQPELIFENKPIPKQLIDQYRKNQAAEERANVSMSGPNKAAQTRTWQTLSRMYTDFLGVDPRSNWTMSPRFYALQDILQREATKPTQLAQTLQPLPNTGQTSESITSVLEDEFGPNVRNMQRRGRLRIVDSVDQLPPNVRGQATPRSVGAFDGETSYIIADRVNPQNARRVLLHEVGEHYGLERMLGRDNYRSALNRLKTLRNSDDVVRNAWNQVKQAYPKLKEGSDPYLKEVMAKVAEEAPNMTLVTRLRGLIKNFLTRLGLYNPDTFTSRDLQDLLIHSLRSSLAKDLNPVLAQGGIQLSEQERAELLGMTDESVLDMIERHANTVVDNVGKGWVTMMSPDEFLQLTTSPSYRETLEKQVEQGLGTFKTSPLKNKGKFDIKSMKPMFLEVSDFPVRDASVGDGIPFEYTPEGGYDTEVIKGVPLGVDVKGHEGRHRAIMAKKAGITQMPVMIFSNTAKTKRDVIQERDGPTLRAQVEGQPSVDLASEMIPIDYANEQNIRNMMQGTDIQFMEVPPDMQGTAVFGRLDASEQSFYNNYVNRFDEFRQSPRDSLQDMFVKGRINIASSTAGVEEKLIKDYNGAVNDAMNNVRADILLNQALESNIMASQAAEEGKVDFLDNGLAKVVPDENNINKLIQLREQLGQEVGDPTRAKYLVQHYLVGRRFKREIELNAQREQNIINLKAMIVEQRRILRDSQGRGQAEQRNNAEKLMDRYKKLIEMNRKAMTDITDEQIAAIGPALDYANQHPILNQIGSVVDGINRNRIDMLEKAGYYDADTAAFYRSNLGYVPLFRVIEDLDFMHPGTKEYFQGFANLGREYEFRGSERDVDDVLNNMLKQHFWAVNAAVRNNANFQTAKALGMHETVTDPETGAEVERLMTLDKKPDGRAGESVAPVYINGERKFIEYSDPNLAIAIQGAVPAFTGILAWFGQASKIFRLGITANPIFQSYQVVNDAISAALFSGVKNPFALGKEIIAGFAKDTFNSTDAINKQMARLGIAGGYGKTARDIFEQSERKFNLANNSLIKNLYDKADKFASKSDLAQRRGIFIQTLLETGGVRQPDGSVQGGNEVLAMNRALNIINWQKRGLATPVRALTHVVPFLNAYIQGMDVLMNAIRGKGISGQESRKAQMLLFKTAMTLMALNAMYAMLVAGDDEYDKQDDRTKFRNYFIPGTNFKMPVRAEISFLTKYLPEQTYQYMLKRGTNDEPDSRKLAQGFSTAFTDAMLSPNLFPQLFRAGFEVATNYDFYNDRPLIGMGLNRLATSEQYNERTSQFARWIGASGIVAPINVDHLVRGYTGTLGSTALYLTDSIANLFYTNKLPERPLRELPIISPLMMRPEGRDKLNDFYDLKQMSDEVSATFNNYVKLGKGEQAREYRKDNVKLMALRGQINNINNRLKTIRDQRKLIVENPRMSAEVKRERLEKLDKMMNTAVINVSRLRRNAGL